MFKSKKVKAGKIIQGFTTTLRDQREKSYSRNKDEKKRNKRKERKKESERERKGKIQRSRQPKDFCGKDGKTMNVDLVRHQ